MTVRRDSTLAIAKRVRARRARPRLPQRERRQAHRDESTLSRTRKPSSSAASTPTRSSRPTRLLQVVPRIREQASRRGHAGHPRQRNRTTCCSTCRKSNTAFRVFNRFMLAALGSAFITPGPFSIFRAAVVRESSAAGGMAIRPKTWRWRCACRTPAISSAMRRARSRAHGDAAHAQAPLPPARALDLRLAAQRRRLPPHDRQRQVRQSRHHHPAVRAHLDRRRHLLLLPHPVSISATLSHEIIKIEVTGVSCRTRRSDLFYLNTSMMWFLVWIAVALDPGPDRGGLVHRHGQAHASRSARRFSSFSTASSCRFGSARRSFARYSRPAYAGARSYGWNLSSTRATRAGAATSSRSLSRRLFSRPRSTRRIISMTSASPTSTRPRTTSRPRSSRPKRNSTFLQEHSCSDVSETDLAPSEMTSLGHRARLPRSAGRQPGRDHAPQEHLFAPRDQGLPRDAAARAKMRSEACLHPLLLFQQRRLQTAVRGAGLRADRAFAANIRTCASIRSTTISRSARCRR